MTHSLSVAPLYLLFKDHKGWQIDSGTPPPSRPVVSAGSGQNDHLSEIISHILEPIVNMNPGGMEMTSTGDFLALVDGINKMVIPYEDISLEEVDKHLDEQISESDPISLDDVDNHLDAQAKEAQDRYDKFDDMNIKERTDDENLPEGWKMSMPNGWKQKDLPKGWKESEHQEDNTRGKGATLLLGSSVDTTSAVTDPPLPPAGWKVGDLPEGGKGDEKLIGKEQMLNKRWKDTEYELVLKKMKVTEKWPRNSLMIKEALWSWMFENEVETLVEECEDILDGLEEMNGDETGEVTEEVLMDAAEIVTAIIVARSIESSRAAPIFQKDGKKTASKIRRIGRAEGMIKMREELRKVKNSRLKPNNRNLNNSDFDDMDIKSKKRVDCSKRMDRGVLRSDNMDNKYVQDKGSKILIVGSDVEALYPSLDAIEIAEIVYDAVMRTKVRFENIDWMEGCKYIALTSTEQECRIGPLKRVLPTRRSVNGTRPGITGEDPLSKETGSQDQWEFKNLGSNGLTNKEKQLVMAKVLKTAVLAIFKTHTYSFNQKFYLQKNGGPIGLRSTCCVARLVMTWWDSMLVEALESLNIKKVAGARYMDDIRVWLHAIRLGWRWVNGELLYKKEWKLEEVSAGMTALQKTEEVLKLIMNGICGWLSLTMETEEMFGGWLPTLDLEIRVNDQIK